MASTAPTAARGVSMSAADPGGAGRTAAAAARTADADQADRACRDAAGRAVRAGSAATAAAAGRRACWASSAAAGLETADVAPAAERQGLPDEHLWVRPAAPRAS